MSRDKLWRYTRVSRIWARSLMGGGLLVLLIGIAVEIGAPEGEPTSWTLVAVGTAVPTCVLFVFLLRSWMRDGALPSSRLDTAGPASALGRLRQPTQREWITWSLTLGGLVTLGCLALTGFLVGVLGGGGTAEGVVVGVTVAWGVVTSRDVAVVEAVEAADDRDFYAACRRPVSVGQRLVWRERPAPEGTGGD